MHAFQACLARARFGTSASITVAQAESHREAPLIAQDPAADITDVYAFVSFNDPSKVTFIMNVIPSQEPNAEESNMNV